MSGHWRELMKHSAVYGLGNVLSRMASLFLLPVYTRYLSLADYGCIALLDVTVAILRMVLASGMSPSVKRHHFEAKTPEEQSAVWWTALGLVSGVSAVVIFCLWTAREAIASAILGDVAEGGTLVALVLANLWCGLAGQLAEQHLQVCKRSGLSVSLALSRLLLNIGINVGLLMAGWGVVGVLLGNLISTASISLVRLALLARGERFVRVDRAIARDLLTFGSPLMLTGILSLLMHQADRYFLRVLLDLKSVGLYAVAYTVAQGANTVLLSAFNQIWDVMVYDVAKKPDAKWVYAEILEYFVYALALGMLALSFLARPLLRIMASPEFLPAAELVPIICLAYVFFSLHSHFRVPVLLAKRTLLLLPACMAGAAANVASNAVLISLFGMHGAAWASVLTFAVYSFTGLAIYRRIDVFPYPMGRILVCLLGMVMSYAAVDALRRWWEVGAIVEFAASSVVLMGWALVLFWRPLRAKFGSVMPHVSASGNRATELASGPRVSVSTPGEVEPSQI